MNEQVVHDVAASMPALRAAVVRCFNPVGTYESGSGPGDGYSHDLLHAVASVAAGLRERLDVYGGDYPTPDGTAMRDFVHVEDLAAGHAAALDAIAETDVPVSTWNLGSGRATSVLELVRAYERASGRAVPYRIVERRRGDVAVSYADPALADDELGWRTSRTVADICHDHWRWQQLRTATSQVTAAAPWQGRAERGLHLVSAG
jgi:UDP-glucose 4-epimerase